MTKMIARAGALVAASVCLLAISPVQALEKEEPPVGSEPKGFELPKIEKYNLRNGVEVTLVPYGRVPKATVRAVVRSGNLNDGDKTWIADLTTEMMQEGANGQSSAELAVVAAGMGGNLNIGAGADRTFALIDVLSERAPDAVGLLADVLQRPNFPEGELQRVKENLIRNVSVARTRPQSIANQSFRAILYPDHPYGRTLPQDGQIEAYTLDDVKAYHGENFGGARTSIYVVGNFDRRKVKREIKKAFGKWEKGNPPLDLPSSANQEPSIVLVDRAGAPQSTIRLGKRVPALDGTQALEAADTLLGGYFSSRITRNIREDKGYTYSPRSFVSNFYKAANWEQDADISSEATGPALAEIFKEIQTLQNEAPTEDELQGIKNYMNGIFVIQLASRGGMANQLSFVDLHGLGTEYLENFVNEIQGLSADDLKNAAKTHLEIDDMSLVVVGPLDSVRGQLEALPEIADRLPAVEGQ